MNLSKVFKGLLFLGAFIATTLLSAQEVSITSLDADAAEVTAGPQDLASFTISTPPGIFLPIDVEYTVTGTATLGDDYTLVTGTVNLTVAANSVTIPITAINDDDIVEGLETIVVTLTSVSDPMTNTINSSANQVTISIADNDEGLVFLDSVAEILTVNEDGTLQAPPEFGQFRPSIDKANGTSANLTITYQITGSAVDGVDYDLTNAVILTFANNGISLVRNIRVAPIDDSISETDETVTITLLSTSNPLYTIGTPASATITIIDDDCAAGTAVPIFNANPTTLCDVASVDLNSYYSGVVPTGANLSWSTFPNPTEAQLLTGTAVTAAPAGTYYGLFTEGTGTAFCASPSTELEIVLNTSPSAGTADTGLALCNETGFGEATSIDLDDTLTGADAGGAWTYFSSSPANLPNPGINGNNVVNFNGDDAGTYVFRYMVTGIAPCTDATENVSIVVTGCDPCTAGDTAPPLNTATATNRCDEASVNLNTFVVGGASSAPVGTALRWSSIPNPTTAGDLVATTATVSGTYYGVYWDAIAPCASPSTQVDLLLSTSPTAGTNANGSACNNPNDDFGATLLDLDTLLAANIDPGTWAFTSGPETAIPNVSNAVEFSGRLAGTYRYTYTTNNAVAPCSNDSAVFTISVSDCDPCVAGNTAPVLDPDTPIVACDIFTASFNDYTNSTPPAGTELRWSTDSNTDNTNAHLTATQAANPPTVGGTFYGFFWDNNNQCASPTLQIDLVLNITPTLTDVVGDERCGTGTLMLTAAASDNATINWYFSETSTTILGTGSSFTTPEISITTSYFAEATLNGCASVRQEAIAIVQQQPSAGIPQNGGNASACSVTGRGGLTILDLDDLISGEDAGNWAYTSGPFQNLDIPSNNVINFEGAPDGEFVFTYTTTEAQAPCSNESTVITITVNDCDVDTDMDGIFDGPESILGTDPNNPDTDGDGINDGDEVGQDTDNPLDSDLDADGNPSPDGIIDALDSNILDEDGDGVVDQLDPVNTDTCIPSRLNGICDFDGDGITDSDEQSNGSDPDDPCDPDIENSACNAEVDLEVLKEVDNLNATIGDAVVFTITVNNLSNSHASRIIIGDLLESGFEYVSHSPELEQYDPETGEWSIPLIEGMDSAVLEITVNILQGGTYTNIAEVLDVFQTDINPANDRSDPVTLPIEIPEGIDLVLEKTALSENPLVNEEVIFTLKVTNESIDTNPVTNVEVRDILDTDNFEYISHDNAVGDFDVGTGIWSIPSIAKDQEVDLEIRVRVPNVGEFTNTASIIRSTPIDGNPDNDESTVRVKVSLPTPADVGFLFNQFSPNGDGTNDVLKINRVNSATNEEEEIRYTIQIFNRYGNLVFEAISKSDSEVWDGTWEGKDAPSGTYFYTMSIDVGDGLETKKGWIQLIR